MSTPQQPTKKERREAARSARIEAEQQAAASDARKKRLGVILGAVGLVAVIAIVLIATSSSGSDDNKVKEGKVNGVPEMKAMLDGIPQTGITLGNKDAKVQVVEFIDPQCPICKEFANEVFPTLVQDYIRTGKVLYETRTLDFLDNNFGTTDSNRGARYLNAAGFQNKMQDLQALIYSNQGQEGTGYMTEKWLETLGSKIPGFDTKKAATDANTAKAKGLIGEANTLFQKYGGTGTPTVLVGPNGGTLAQIQVNNVTDASQYKAGIDAALKSAGS
jgi:protein-disulfide isomerase